MQDKEPTTFKEVSGQDALKTHMADQASINESEAQATTLQRPVILGERNMSEEGRPSIAEVMHQESKIGDVSLSTLESNLDPSQSILTSTSEAADGGEPSTTDELPSKPNSR